MLLTDRQILLRTHPKRTQANDRREKNNIFIGILF